MKKKDNLIIVHFINIFGEYQPNCYRYGRAKEKDITDVIVHMKNVLLDKPISRAEYKMPSISELKRQLAEEKKYWMRQLRDLGYFFPVH